MTFGLFYMLCRDQNFEWFEKTLGAGWVPGGLVSGWLVGGFANLSPPPVRNVLSVLNMLNVLNVANVCWVAGRLMANWVVAP